MQNPAQSTPHFFPLMEMGKQKDTPPAASAEGAPNNKHNHQHGVSTPHTVTNNTSAAPLPPSSNTPPPNHSLPPSPRQHRPRSQSHDETQSTETMTQPRERASSLDDPFIQEALQLLRLYRPTFYFPTGLYKRRRIKRLINTIMQHPMLPVPKLKDMISAELNRCCQGEISQRKYDFESGNASFFLPRRTALGQIFDQLYPERVRQIESATKAQYNYYLRRKRYPSHRYN